MRHLFTIDTHDYDPNGTVEVRPSVRGIVVREGRVLLVHSLKYDYYKFPGGGIEPGEDPMAAMIRETREEAGLTVIPESVREYGLVHRIQRGVKDENECFIQDNFYYLCQVGDAVAQNLDDYEAEERFTPEFVTPERAIHVNRFHDHQGKWGIVQQRDNRVLEMLMEEGYLN